MVEIDVSGAGHHAGSHGNRGVSSLDNLPAFPCAKLKLDQFFLQWLSEHQDTVTSLLEDVVAGRTLRTPAMGANPSASPLSPSTSHALFSSTPPLSPSKANSRSPLSPLSPNKRTPPVSAAAKRGASGPLPVFYQPRSGPSTEPGKQAKIMADLEAGFADKPGGITQAAAAELLCKVLGLPRMVGRSVFVRLTHRAVADESALLQRPQLLDYVLKRRLFTGETVVRVFNALRADNQQYLTYADLNPVLECVLQYHPGLEFLKETAEFQRKYAETVVYRIFYTLNRSSNGRLTLRELRRSDLQEALELLDSEEDINKILKYFSYEHFYVIYCKFWELDTDHDFFIDRNDLAHYSQGALSLQIIERVFEQVPRKFASAEPGKMSYEDFVWFVLSEEDKTTDTALEYWFSCVDLDCDGVVRPREMWFFYEEQLRRMEQMPAAETVQFEDLVCQLHDMLAPEAEGAYTIRDLKRTRPHCAVLFNALFNLHKFLAFENRDPFAARAEAAEFAGLSEWDRFAKIEYCRLAAEDENEDVQMDADEGWPDAG